MSAPEPSWVYRLVHPSAEAAAWICGGMEVEGLERLPLEGPLIVAFNHCSWWDGPLASMVVARRRFPTFLAKEELFRFPPMGWFLRKVGVMPLDRGRSGDVGAMRTAVGILEQGGCLLLFPEGTRARDGISRRPKPGVGFLANAGRAPVAAVRIWNTEKFPTRVRMKFGPILRYHGEGGKASFQAFAEEVMDAILKL